MEFCGAHLHTWMFHGNTDKIGQWISIAATAGRSSLGPDKGTASPAMPFGCGSIGLSTETSRRWPGLKQIAGLLLTFICVAVRFCAGRARRADARTAKCTIQITASQRRLCGYAGNVISRFTTHNIKIPRLSWRRHV